MTEMTAMTAEFTLLPKKTDRKSLTNPFSIPVFHKNLEILISSLSLGTWILYQSGFKHDGEVKIHRHAPSFHRHGITWRFTVFTPMKAI
jgi:hypothetical protein